MSIMRTIIPIWNETGYYEQEIDGDRYSEIEKTSTVKIIELTVNKELSKVDEEECEARLVLNCRAIVNGTEKVTCELVSYERWDEDSEYYYNGYNIEAALEDEVNWINTGEINLNDWSDRQGRKYKCQIIDKSSLFGQVCIGEPRLVRPTVKYFE